MKKIFLLFLLVPFYFFCLGQSAGIFKNIQVKDGIFLGGKWINSFSDDIDNFGMFNVIPTEQAVKSYVDGKLSIPTLDQVINAGNITPGEIKTGLHEITILEAAGSSATEVMRWNIPLEGIARTRYKWLIVGGTGSPGILSGNLMLQAFDNSGVLYKTPLIWYRQTASWVFSDNVYVGNNSPESRLIQYSESATPIWNAGKLNGITVGGTPGDGEVLTFNASASRWNPSRGAFNITDPSLSGIAGNFLGRVTGYDARESNEFVTLNQLNDRLQVGSDRAGFADFSAGIRTLSINTPVISDNSIVILTVQQTSCPDCTISPVVVERAVGTSFTIHYPKPEGETGRIGWMIVNPSN